MKKILIILLIFNAMGFTVASNRPAEKKADHRKKAISCSAGYIEVSGPADYTITTGSSD